MAPFEAGPILSSILRISIQIPTPGTENSNEDTSRVWLLKWLMVAFPEWSFFFEMINLRTYFSFELHYMNCMRRRIAAWFGTFFFFLFVLFLEWNCIYYTGAFVAIHSHNMTDTVAWNCMVKGWDDIGGLRRHTRGMGYNGTWRLHERPKGRCRYAVRALHVYVAYMLQS